MVSAVAIYINTAHPRVSGENTMFGLAPIETSGSSPRERGKPPNHGGSIKDAGLIPA